ncbi:MAG: hypothetical protein M1837_006477 [Sclerophora amabilis]|nr:MAG: hypothetical protein M1837_006477 [Sclerophora amabilis]
MVDLPVLISVPNGEQLDEDIEVVAMKTFMDNVCRQVVDRHILADLRHIFLPTTVMDFTGDELLRRASEPQSQQSHRVSYMELVRGLRTILAESSR